MPRLSMRWVGRLPINRPVTHRHHQMARAGGQFCLRRAGPADGAVLRAHLSLHAAGQSSRQSPSLVQTARAVSSGGHNGQEQPGAERGTGDRRLPDPREGAVRLRALWAWQPWMPSRKILDRKIAARSPALYPGQVEWRMIPDYHDFTIGSMFMFQTAKLRRGVQMFRPARSNADGRQITTILQ